MVEERRKRKRNLIEQRNLELRRVFREESVKLANRGKLAAEIWALAVKRPASRLYVSEDVVVRELNERERRGETASHRRRIADLRRGYERARFVDATLTVAKYAEKLLYLPAKEFYINPLSAKVSVLRTCRRLGLRL